eukprot:TRINITY_DN4167_c1_g1_i1.p1 TRINITY_DN4167_c1_g1~~TRINITY_DN4167_c1_g1_i1.p1  ORF type:complete len:533 (+),score=143.64 TRINITY_DN4167_c1_g1_i1:119-1717(+)
MKVPAPPPAAHPSSEPAADPAAGCTQGATDEGAQADAARGDAARRARLGVGVTLVVLVFALAASSHWRRSSRVLTARDEEAPPLAAATPGAHASAAASELAARAAALLPPPPAPADADTPPPAPGAPVHVPPGTKWLTYRGCHGGNGVHNQRQTLQTMALFAKMTGRGLQMMPYVPNVHDRKTRLLQSELWDLAALRKAVAPLPVLDETQSEEAYNVKCPKGWFVFPIFKVDMDGVADVNLTREQLVINHNTSDKVCIMTFNCWGSLLWKMRRNPKADFAWAVQQYHLQLAPAPPLLAAAKKLFGYVATLRKGPDNLVHSVHARVLHKNDFNKHEYPPLMDCAYEGWGYLDNLCSGLWEQARSCQCVIPQKGNESEATADYGDVVANRKKQGRLKAGDVMFIATNGPQSPRVLDIKRQAQAAGARAVTRGDLEAEHPDAAAVSAELKSDVQRAVVELTVAALATGFFVPSCLATTSEYTVIYRAALRTGLDSSELEALLLKVDMKAMDCLQKAMLAPPPRPQPRRIKKRRNR